MTATSLKLPDGLKRRIERLAAAARKSPHAYMIEALLRDADQSELRQRFAADAEKSEQQAMETGKAYGLDATFDYLATRLDGGKARRPRARSWRASK